MNKLTNGKPLKVYTVTLDGIRQIRVSPSRAINLALQTAEMHADDLSKLPSFASLLHDLRRKGHAFFNYKSNHKRKTITIDKEEVL